MKNNRIEILIQKKLDRVADPQEEKELDALIASSRELSDTYTDQKLIQEWLNKMPVVEPPDGLVDSVMAALPVRPIRSAARWHRRIDLLSLFPRHRFAAGFAMGVAICVIFLGLIWISRPSTIASYNDLYGTTVLSRQFSYFEKIDLTRAGGEISWNEDTPERMVRLSLRPTAPVTAMLQFNPDVYRLSHFYQESWCESGAVMVQPNCIRVDLQKANRLVFVLSSQGEVYPPIQFKLLQGDTVLFSKELGTEQTK